MGSKPSTPNLRAVGTLCTMVMILKRIDDKNDLSIIRAHSYFHVLQQHNAFHRNAFQVWLSCATHNMFLWEHKKVKIPD